MSVAVTIRLNEDLDRMLEQAARRSGRARSDIVRDALRRQLAIDTFDALRKEILPYAERAGYLTDEDVFNALS